MTELSELLERVKVATGPDRELDIHIVSYFREGAVISEDRLGSFRAGFGPDGDVWPPVTASIDAALALVERLLNEDEALELLSMVATETSEDTVNGSIKTLPLAILSALLQALGEKP